MNLPHGWTETKIGDFAPFIYGKPLPDKLRNPDGQYPVYGSNGIVGYHDESCVESAGIIVGRKGSVGNVHFSESEFWPIDTTFYVANCEDRDLRFTFYLLLNLNLENFVSDNTVPGLNRNTAHAIKIAVPPLPEQRAIAQLLARWDDALRDLAQLIEAKTRLKRALMQQLLTGKRRFAAFDKNHETRQTKLGVRPVEWPVLKIGDIANEVSERTGANELPVLSCTKYAGLVDSLEYFGKRIFSENTANYKVVRRGQFAYATNHIEEGSIGLLTEIEAGVVSPMYTVFQTTDKVAPAFLYLLLKTEMYRHLFQSNTSASVDRRGSLRWNQFSKIPVALPSLPEQQKIVETFQMLDREIQLLERQRAALARQKRGLMARLLSGQTRLNVEGDA